MIELRRRYSGSKGSDSPSFSRLPAGYQEVEYIQPKAKGAFIKTGILFGEDTKMTIGFEFEENPTSDSGYVAGLFQGNQNQYAISKLFGSNTECYARSFNAPGSTIALVKTSIAGKHLAVLHNDYVILDGEKGENFGNVPNGVYGYELLLFACFHTSSNNIINFSLCKIYPVQIEQGGVLVRDLIPCYRTSDRVAGMYDIVNDVFYTNVGTGEFLVGADVGSEEANPSYIEVPIGAWLHTGIIASGDLTFELTFSYVYTYDGLQPDWFFISRTSSSSGLFGILNGQNGAALGIRYGTNPTGIVHNFIISDTSKHTIKFGKGKFYLDGVLLHEQDRQNFTSVELLLSKGNAETNIISEYAKNYYSVRAYDIHDNLTHDYIPAIKDGEAGLYDTISGTFQKNAGDGVIIAY